MPQSFAPGNIENYTIGGMRFTFTPSGGGDPLDFGNIVTGSFSSDITFLDHFSARSGQRVRDRRLVQELEVSISLTLDEPTVELMNYFMLGGAVTSNTFAPYTNLERRGGGFLEGVSATGNNWEWTIPLCTVQPDGEFSYNDDDWSDFAVTVDVLADLANNCEAPYGVIEHKGIVPFDPCPSSGDDDDDDSSS